MRLATALLTAPLLSAQAGAPSAADIAQKQLGYTRAHYTKYDYRIPMRDGIRLFTSVFAPKDTSPKDIGQRYPILIQRTPYWFDADSSRSRKATLRAHRGRALRLCPSSSPGRTEIQCDRDRTRRSSN